MDSVNFIADQLARFFLTINDKNVLIAIAFIGILLGNREKWLRIVLIFAFTLIFKEFLKDIWKAQLPDVVRQTGLDYAFPSGHTITEIIFFGWLMIEFRNRALQIILCNLLFLFAVLRLYKGYHYPIDILGAYFIGLGILGANYLLLKVKLFQNLKIYGGFYLFLALLVSYSTNAELFQGSWRIGLSLLLGSFIGFFLAEHTNVNSNKKTKVFIILANAGLLFLVYCLLNLFKGQMTPFAYTMLLYGVSTAIVASGCWSQLFRWAFKSNIITKSI